jgi:hypothetical protein
MLRGSLVNEIDAKIDEISTRTTEPDPGYGGPSAQVGRQITSAIIFEGHVVHRAIELRLAATARYRVMRNVHVALPRDARVLAEVNGDRVSEMPATGQGPGACMDILVFDRLTRRAGFYDAKRGVRDIGANHRRQLISNHRVVAMTGRSLAERLLGERVSEVMTGILSYYGATTADPLQTYAGREIDEHFEVDVTSEIRAHLTFQRYRMGQALPGTVAATYKLPEA